MQSPKILIVDNEDSFTYNLVQLLENARATVSIVSGREQQIIDYNKFNGILFSPGPGLPSEFPLMAEILKEVKMLPILGICLGMQAIAIHFGARLYRQEQVQHGQVHQIQINLGASQLFRNLPQELEVGLYHSWAVDEFSIPAELKVSCISQQNIIMGLSHQTQMIEGLQFHPESFLTPYGKHMIGNWLESLI